MLTKNNHWEMGLMSIRPTWQGESLPGSGSLTGYGSRCGWRTCAPFGWGGLPTAVRLYRSRCG